MKDEWIWILIQIESKSERRGREEQNGKMSECKKNCERIVRKRRRGWKEDEEERRVKEARRFVRKES